MVILLDTIGLNEHPAKDLILSAMEQAFDDGFKIAESIVIKEMAKALQAPSWLGG
jgi:hypothetical protein